MKAKQNGTNYHGLAWAFVCVVFLVLGFTYSGARASNSSQDAEVVVMQSWKKGDSKIDERVLYAALGSDHPQYEFDLFSTDKVKRFRLRLRQSVENTVRTPGLQCWIADFREITKDNISTAKQIGYNLFSVEGPGVGDNFPREEWAGYFCPIEKPNPVLDGLFYPIRAERRFFVEGFVVSLQVTDYLVDKERKTLSQVKLRIESSNR